MMRQLFRSLLILSAAAALLSAQGSGVAPATQAPPPTPVQLPQQQGAGVAPSTPAPPPAAVQLPGTSSPGTPATQATQAPANGGPVSGRMSDTDPFSMDNVSLTEMI